MNHKPPPSMVELLTKIWQDVLGRSSIGPDDVFFDLGGTDSLADRLFAEIAHVCGRELPSATICHAQTITALAAALEQPSLPRFSPFVPLKAGIEPPPILIAPGLEGRANFSKLAKHILTGHPVYGIQAKGVDGLDEPLDRIEDMAAFYLSWVKELQPHGPYILIGYSFGGLVALEMAQQMSERGENIALLVMVDAYPHPRYLPVGQLRRFVAQRMRRHLGEMKQKSPPRAVSYLFSELRRRFHAPNLRSRSPNPSEPPHLAFSQTTSRVKEKAYVALSRYRPRVYHGKVKFVKSENDTYFTGDAAAVWSNLLTDFEVEIVPGNHLNMVTTHFEGLAAVLTRCVRGVPSQK